MDAIEELVRRDNQNRARLRVLAHLEAALREIRGYHQLKLLLDGDTVTVVYGCNSRQRVNIACDNELAMILDVIKKIMY